TAGGRPRGGGGTCDTGGGDVRRGKTESRGAGATGRQKGGGEGRGGGGEGRGGGGGERGREEGERSDRGQGRGERGKRQQQGQSGESERIGENEERKGEKSDEVEALWRGGNAMKDKKRSGVPGEKGAELELACMRREAWVSRKLDVEKKVRGESELQQDDNGKRQGKEEKRGGRYSRTVSLRNKDASCGR
ncbi:hypothetical protein NYA10_29575, partial [Burkholderia thailandensis]|nr:hypothetical protein [Burkholderia thailandensis]